MEAHALQAADTSHGFFYARRIPNYGLEIFGQRSPKHLDYVNVPRIIADLVTSKICTLHELQTIYSAEDAYNLLEILNVNAANAIRSKPDG